MAAKLTVSRAAYWTTTNKTVARPSTISYQPPYTQRQKPNHVLVGLAQWLVFFRSFFQNLMGTENTQQSYSVNLALMLKITRYGAQLRAQIQTTIPRSPFTFMMACVRRLFSMKDFPATCVIEKAPSFWRLYSGGLPNGDTTPR